MWLSQHCSALPRPHPSILSTEEALAMLIFFPKESWGRKWFLTSFKTPSLDCTQYAGLCSDRKEIDTVIFEGIPYPAHFLENQNAEALASPPSTQWNPCSWAYFWVRQRVCHLPGNGFSHPRHECAIPCPLCLERGLRT